MQKKYEDKSYLDQSLKNLNGEFVWKQEHKQNLHNKIMKDLNKIDRQMKRKNIFKFSSVGAIVVLLLMIGYNYISQGDTSFNNRQLSVGHPNEDNNTNKEKTTDQDITKESDIKVENSKNTGDTESPRHKTGPSTKEELVKLINLREPKYIPDQVKGTPKYMKTINDDLSSEAYADYFHSEDFHLSLVQTKGFVNEKENLSKLKEKEKEMFSRMKDLYKYKHQEDELIELKINGHPAILALENKNSSFNSIHIAVKNYGFNLFSKGLSKEELIKVAQSIDLSGL
ncbi:hypothetical protein [Metabacillus fastidiosus]|uniref:hypothetical protein n=1 Tax=Metabacillus fastidiosus TaxID=1458 RepID=UPI003D2B3E8D